MAFPTVNQFMANEFLQAGQRSRFSVSTRAFCLGSVDRIITITFAVIELTAPPQTDGADSAPCLKKPNRDQNRHSNPPVLPRCATNKERKKRGRQRQGVVGVVLVAGHHSIIQPTPVLGTFPSEISEGEGERKICPVRGRKVGQSDHDDLFGLTSNLNLSLTPS